MPKRHYGYIVIDVSRALNPTSDVSRSIAGFTDSPSKLHDILTDYVEREYGGNKNRLTMDPPFQIVQYNIKTGRRGRSFEFSL
ncbi:MAG: hypothetical protein HYS80_01200 [Candidatus Aenigmarchaeota archaeon]|nr:hypothetical protein [Candidatus Aenigmarchaeota archaeon]